MGRVIFLYSKMERSLVLNPGGSVEMILAERGVKKERKCWVDFSPT